MKPDMPAQALLDAIDADTMLGQVQDWAAINTGTANITGLAQLADVRELSHEGPFVQQGDLHLHQVYGASESVNISITLQ